MSVRKRTYADPETGTAKKVWVVDVDYQFGDGRRQRIRKVSPVQTRRGAEQYEREIRAALLAGTYGKEANKRAPTLEEFHREFMASYVANNNKPSEESSKDGHFRNHLVPFFGSKKLQNIGAKEVELFKAQKLKDGCGKKAIKNQLSTLRKMLNVAGEWGLIEQAPRIKPFRLEPTQFDFLTFDEAERLIAAADVGLWRTMILVALNTGLRLGELMGLRWEDVDLVAGRLNVRFSSWKGQMVTPKSGRHRGVNALLQDGMTLQYRRMWLRNLETEARAE
jgi:integrase